ncbi:hypothetical protein [Wolbachia endosymbiont (group B) of Limnophora tigrina]|uniref:hypothetical protein n=1 Tax=Wolbachia endosymbiont (group B) of Limnophora tigrina TaxID=3139317 RepID=UPI0035B54105
MRNFFLSYFRQKVSCHSNGCKIVAPNALFSSSQCVIYNCTDICSKNNVLNIIAGFASNAKVSFQCLTLESSLRAIPLKMLCFNIRLATFTLTNSVSDQNYWIPVSGHWDDILLFGTNCSYISMFVQLCWDDIGRLMSHSIAMQEVHAVVGQAVG